MVHGDSRLGKLIKFKLGQFSSSSTHDLIIVKSQNHRIFLANPNGLHRSDVIIRSLMSELISIQWPCNKSEGYRNYIY